MELYELKSGLEKARLLLNELYISSNIEVLKREIEGLTVQTLDEHFWDDQNKAKKLYDKLNEMKKITDSYDELNKLYDELMETYQFVKETGEKIFLILYKMIMYYFKIN
jgi:peptide chain release factor 2